MIAGTMRLHLLSLPHTMTTPDFNACAYTAKARKFATMMSRAGCEVILYAGQENTAACAEHVTLITRATQDTLLGDQEWYRDGMVYGVDWDPETPLWREFCAAAIRELAQRLEPQDIVCLPTGHSMWRVRAAFPDALMVEYGIGYEGILENTFHVFESYAWMHAVYGGRYGAAGANGRHFDAVIGNFFDPDDFPASVLEPDSYFAFMSRMTPRKGYSIAVDATRELDAPLLIAGVGGDTVPDSHVAHIGYVNAEDRADYLACARALFVPTLYLEPFGGVAVEAMLCGTPVLTTDWGAFPELVRQGIDGYRCHTLREFVAAAADVGWLDRDGIRLNALGRWSLDVVAEEYLRYFQRLRTLFGEGFYEGTSAAPAIISA